MSPLSWWGPRAWFLGHTVPRIDADLAVQYVPLRKAEPSGWGSFPWPEQRPLRLMLSVSQF